jgi:hypothetical protein
MNKVKVAAAVLLVAAGVSGFAQTEAVVQAVSGRVEVMQPGRAWVAAVPGMKLSLGASVSTSFQSEATLALGASLLQVRPLTRMRLDQLARQGNTVSTELSLRVGRVRAEVKGAEGLLQDFKVRSPISTAAVRGTTFDYDGVNTDVEDGVVNLSNNQSGQGTSVGAGEQGSVSDPNAPPTGGEDNKEQQSTTEPSAGPTIPLVTPPSKSGTIRINWTYYEMPS